MRSKEWLMVLNCNSSVSCVCKYKVREGFKEDEYCLLYRIILIHLGFFFGERSEGDSVRFNSLLM